MTSRQPQEGGWGWLVAAASFLTHFITCGIGYSSGIFYHILKEEFDKSHFQTAWAGALMLSMTTLAGIPAVMVMYWFDCRVTTMLGGVLAAAGLGLASLTTTLWETYTTAGVMTGAGFGFALAPSVMILDDYFREGKCLATGTAISGVGIGILFMPYVVNALSKELEWSGMFLALAGIAAQLIVCGATMRPQTETRRYSNRDMLRIFEPSLLESSAFSCMCVCNAIWSFGISIMYTYLPSYAIDTGLSLEDGIHLIAVTGLCSFTSRLMFIMFSQSAKLDHTSIIICTVGLTTILTGVFPELFQHQSGQIGYAIILGMHIGFWSTFMGHVSTELVGEPYMAYGKGFVFMSLGLGLLAGPPTAGWVLDQKEDYQIIFYLAGACLLVSSIIMSSVNLKGDFYRPYMEISSEYWDTESNRSTVKMEETDELL